VQVITHLFIDSDLPRHGIMQWDDDLSGHIDLCRAANLHGYGNVPRRRELRRSGDLRSAGDVQFDGSDLFRTIDLSGSYHVRRHIHMQ